MRYFICVLYPVIIQISILYSQGAIEPGQQTHIRTPCAYSQDTVTANYQLIHAIHRAPLDRAFIIPIYARFIAAKVRFLRPGLGLDNKTMNIQQRAADGWTHMHSSIFSCQSIATTTTTTSITSSANRTSIGKQLSWPAHGVQVEICKWAPLVTIHGRPESMAITLWNCSHTMFNYRS